uniref:Uncharacterized protein n=1 Tax=viral metagenome TaxID=1070528 RepID=A0A6C0LQ30_9ZZZZ
MGQSSSNFTSAHKEQQTEPAAKGHYVSDIKTGYRWATDPIVSGPEVVKKPLGNVVPQFETDNNLKYAFSLPGYPGEVWGPYRKQFTKSDFGGQVFTPPESIDGVPILCRCRDIPTYMRDPRGGRMLQGFGAVTLGKSMPACWDDTESIWNAFGGMYYYLKIRHPDFFTYAASKDGLLGVAKGIATGPVGPVPLALGAYYLTRPKKVAAAAAAAAAPSAVGGTRRRRQQKAKNTRKMNRLKSKRR